MRGNFASLDGALIDKVCQPIIDWFAQHVAIDCFRVARICIDLSALAWIVSQASDAAASPGSVPQGIQFGLIVVGLGAIMMLRATFQRAGGGRQPNPLRAAMFAHRLACLLWLTALLAKSTTMPAGLASMALFAVGGFATVALYVGACSNPPPTRREIRIDREQWRLAPLRSSEPVAVRLL
jgi:hypothetical protein